MMDGVTTIAGYDFPDGLWYHPREHLWLRPEAPAASVPREVTVGVDAMGVDALGHVVHVQLVEAGQAVRRGLAIGSLEAEKMVRPLVAPVSGRLVAVNDELLAAPRLLSADPYGRGWLVRIAAGAWEAESRDLLAGPEAVGAWARAELRAREERA
jgi:glycine cleavage system H protein